MMPRATVIAIHHERPQRIQTSAARGAVATARASGSDSSNENVEPAPGALTTPSLPPMSSTICRAIDKAEAGAAEATRRRRVFLGEFVEDLRLVLGSMPTPVSTTSSRGLASSHPALAERRHAQRHLAAVGELHRIAAEVDEHLAQPDRIDANARQRLRRRIAQQRDALGRGARRKHFRRLLHQLDQVALDGIELQAARFDLREVEHVIDDREQRIGGAMNGLGEASLRGIEPRIEQQRRHAQHAVHRRAQLVAHACDEVTLRAAENLQLLIALFQLVRAHAHGVLQLATVAKLHARACAAACARGNRSAGARATT